MTLVDSSGWLEFFSDGPLAAEYAKRLRRPSTVVTPTLVLYEVYKKIKREMGEDEGLVAVAAMQKTRIVPLTVEIALTAADYSLEYRLAMADAIVLATARVKRAQLVTSDPDLAEIPGVTYLEKLG